MIYHHGKAGEDRGGGTGDLLKLNLNLQTRGILDSGALERR